MRGADDVLSGREIHSARALAAVPVRDTGEALVRFGPDPAEGLTFGPPLPYPWLRTGALARLRAAARLLRAERPGCGLRLLYAYRSLAAQREGFAQARARALAAHPDWDAEALDEEAHLFAALPSVAGHPTGGAVDVTIVERGAALDMGTGYGDWASPLIFTFAEGVGAAQAAHRALLRRVMVAAGFAPFNGEWWHFSFGDREWAAVWGAPAAVYGQLEAPEEG
jgi:D-alanyl-D-alanine dipeptidase